MVNKTYNCTHCGEFIESLEPNKELTHCLQCKRPVTRVFKPIISIWNTGGNYGKSS